MRMESFTISDQKKKILFKSITNGATQKAAAAAADIPISTFYHWKKSAKYLKKQIDHNEVKKSELKADQARLLDFLYALKKAQLNFETANLEIIRKAAEGGQKFTEHRTETRETINPVTGEVMKVKSKTVTVREAAPDWKAAAWKLERLMKNRYSRFLQVDGEVEVKHRLTDDDRRRRLAKLLERQRAGGNGRATNGDVHS